MKTRSSRIVENKKNESAQGFVEFALAVPILLMVLYGLLEVGRLLFIYSSTVTAARQAVRYGAVTGVSDSGFPRYKDCAGIRAAAQNVGFIQAFENISITFDTGPDPDTLVVPPPYDTCDGYDFRDVPLQNGDRLVVSVSTTFVPIVPLVPLEPMTIESSSSRTILRDIDIYVEADPQEWDGEDDDDPVYDLPTPTSTNTNTPTATNTPTETPTNTPTPLFSPTPSNTPTNTFTPTITNTPTITFTPTVTFTPTATGTATYTPSPTATPIECYISHAGVSITQNKFLLTIHNDSNYPITIEEITVFYNNSSPSGQALGAIYSDGLLIWNQTVFGSPVTISNFIAIEPIDPWSSMALKLFFTKDLKINGSENVMVSFVENGCPIHNTAQ